jgi:hypothetical protein
MTRNTEPPSSPTSYTGRTLGCDSCAITRASSISSSCTAGAAARRSIVGCDHSGAGTWSVDITLIATSRNSCGSCAR